MPPRRSTNEVSIPEAVSFLEAERATYLSEGGDPNDTIALNESLTRDEMLAAVQNEQSVIGHEIRRLIHLGNEQGAKPNKLIELKVLQIAELRRHISDDLKRQQPPRMIILDLRSPEEERAHELEKGRLLDFCVQQRLNRHPNYDPVLDPGAMDPNDFRAAEQASLSRTQRLISDMFRPPR